MSSACSCITYSMTCIGTSNTVSSIARAQRPRRRPHHPPHPDTIGRLAEKAARPSAWGRQENKRRRMEHSRLGRFRLEGRQVHGEINLHMAGSDRGFHSWRAKRHETVALSTTEAEYTALSPYKSSIPYRVVEIQLWTPPSDLPLFRTLAFRPLDDLA